MSARPQSSSPPVRSPSRRMSCFSPKTFNLPLSRSVWLQVAEPNSLQGSAQPAATPRQTYSYRPIPSSPGQTFSRRRASQRPTPRCLALPGRAALESKTRVSHFIPGQPLGRARHALPYSLGRPREPGAGSPGRERPTHAAELGVCGRRARG